MAHELDMSTGEAAMAYVGTQGKPWHGLGTPIEEGASPEQIAKAARMAWRVETRFPQFELNGKEYVDKTHQMLVRGDNGFVLDVSGPGYVPHQNEEVLGFFAEYLNVGSMFIDTAGVLQDGKFIWVQAKLGADFSLPGKDLVEGRLLLMNPHQYGKGMIAKMVTERVVCRNTLNMALGEGGGSVKIWHTKEFNKARQDDVKRNLGIAQERFDAFKADAKVLAKTTLTNEDTLAVLVEVFDGKKDMPLEQQGRTITRLAELYYGAGMGATLPSAQGTAWGLLNAATQYFDHEYGRTVDSRMTHSWLGQGDIKKRRLMAELLQQAAA